MDFLRLTAEGKLIALVVDRTMNFGVNLIVQVDDRRMTLVGKLIVPVVYRRMSPVLVCRMRHLEMRSPEQQGMQGHCSFLVLEQLITLLPGLFSLQLSCVVLQLIVLFVQC